MDENKLNFDGFVRAITEQLSARATVRGPSLIELPSFEQKPQYPSRSKAEDVHEMADLLASLANDADLGGLRALVYGPARDLHRPIWLNDPSKLHDALLSCFDRQVVPRVEFRSVDMGDLGVADFIVIVHRDETPYVTFADENRNQPIVRVRTTTKRLNANRADLIALCQPASARRPPRRLTARFQLREGRRSSGDVELRNEGMLPVLDIRVDLPEGAQISFDREAGGLVIARLAPYETDRIPAVLSLQARRTVRRLVFEGRSEDGERVTAELLLPR